MEFNKNLTIEQLTNLVYNNLVKYYNIESHIESRIDSRIENLEDSVSEIKSELVSIHETFEKAFGYIHENLIAIEDIKSNLNPSIKNNETLTNIEKSTVNNFEEKIKNIIDNKLDAVYKRLNTIEKRFEDATSKELDEKINDVVDDRLDVIFEEMDEIKEKTEKNIRNIFSNELDMLYEEFDMNKKRIENSVDDILNFALSKLDNIKEEIEKGLDDKLGALYKDLAKIEDNINSTKVSKITIKDIEERVGELEASINGFVNIANPNVKYVGIESRLEKLEDTYENYVKGCSCNSHSNKTNISKKLDNIKTYIINLEKRLSDTLVGIDDKLSKVQAYLNK